ncbi:MAG: hypothetical protein JWO38_5537 [Gemmataceae bacterium]|nr:hypothetical protein [Gemmataceae bacterium]
MIGTNRLRDLAGAMAAARQAFQVARVLDLPTQADRGRGDRQPARSVGRDGITLREYPHGSDEVASTGVVTVFDRARSAAGERVPADRLGCGSTEAACKTSVTQRLKLSGMRWTKTGAQVILDLRMVLLSGVGDEVYRHVLTPYMENELRTPDREPEIPEQMAAEKASYCLGIKAAHHVRYRVDLVAWRAAASWPLGVRVGERRTLSWPSRYPTSASCPMRSSRNSACGPCGGASSGLPRRTSRTCSGSPGKQTVCRWWASYVAGGGARSPRTGPGDRSGPGGPFRTTKPAAFRTTSTPTPRRIWGSRPCCGPGARSAA